MDLRKLKIISQRYLIDFGFNQSQGETSIAGEVVVDSPV
jgi:hypothetical protein